MIVGIGLDLVDIARVARLLEAKGERAMRRLFSDGEAAYKALAGTEHARGIGWRDIEVEVEWDGRPALRLHGRAAERAAELGVVRTHLSLTHADHTAAAFVVLEGQVPG